MYRPFQRKMFFLLTYIYTDKYQFNIFKGLWNGCLKFLFLFLKHQLQTEKVFIALQTSKDIYTLYISK